MPNYLAAVEGFLTAVIVVALPVSGQAETQSPQFLAVPKTTVFLADRQLGVAGAYQSGADTLYFEAKTPSGSRQMSVRLMDAAGRTIALSGHSMDDVWLPYAGFDAASATRSLGLASALPNALANALDGRLFIGEITALSKVALGAARALPGAEAVVIDSATADLPVPVMSLVEAANSNDSAAAGQLMVNVNTPENLNVTLEGVNGTSLCRIFPRRRERRESGRSFGSYRGECSNPFVERQVANSANRRR